MKEIHW